MLCEGQNPVRCVLGAGNDASVLTERKRKTHEE